MNTTENLLVVDDSLVPWLGNDEDLEYSIVEDDDIESDCVENIEALVI